MSHNLDALLADRETLANRLTTIETALSELRLDVAGIDAEIERARQQRLEMVTRGRRMYALFVELKSELDRYDVEIKAIIDEIADSRIGDREGAYLMKHGMVIARTRVNGSLYTAFVEILDSS